MPFLAELVHHVVAHPLWGLAIAVRQGARQLVRAPEVGEEVWGLAVLVEQLAARAERAAERLHAVSARAAWPDETR
jgi:hypothetical protein